MNEEKRLWKAKCWISGCFSSKLDEEYSDVHEFTVEEAKEFYKGWKADLVKMYSKLRTFSCYIGPLFYKKDGEWIVFEEEK